MLNALSLLNEINDRLGWPQIDTLDKAESARTPTERKLLKLLNRVMKTWCGLDAWPMLRTEGTIVLVPEVLSDSTLLQYVTATRNSDVVTIDNVTLDETYRERAFQAGGDEYVYRIADVLSPTQIRLNRAWISASVTAADEVGFTIAQDKYALPDDYDRPCGDAESFFSPYKISPVDPNEFRRRRIDRDPGITTDEPEVYTVCGTNPGETVQVVQFDPYPKSARLLQFPYQRVHPSINSDNDKIFVAERFVGALIDIILQLATRDYEDDTKTQQIMVDMLRQYNQQAANPGVIKALPQIRFHNQIRADIRQGAYGGGAPADGGDSWDRLDWRY